MGAIFDHCPVDPYVPEGYRYKTISWHEGAFNRFNPLPHTTLIQSKIYNPVHGDLVRTYPPNAQNLLSREDFRALLTKFSTECQLSKEDIILVQLQRIDCDFNNKGLPAVEGFHRDGIDWLGIFVVSRTNIVGGETQIKNEFDEIIFQKTIPAGELLLIDDRRVLHYTTPIEPEPQHKQQYGYRDVVLLTACSKKLMGDLNK